MAVLSARGTEIAYDEYPAGADGGEPLLCLHETATSGEAWKPLAGALAGRMRLVAPDRRGWRHSPPPQDYRATTVPEQAEDAAVLLEELGLAPAALCGAGIGAAIALCLTLARPELVSGAVLIEPPLLAFLPAATEVLSDNRLALSETASDGGSRAALDLCLSGELEALAPGTDRLPVELTAPARERSGTLFAELGAVPAWALPLTALGGAERPATIVISSGTPRLVAEAARMLAVRLAGSELLELPGDRGPAELSAPEEIAAAVSAPGGG